jgi:cob(I)alamin adenosyltransferase
MSDTGEKLVKALARVQELEAVLNLERFKTEKLKKDLQKMASDLLCAQRASTNYAEVYVRVGERHMVTSVTKEQLELSNLNLLEMYVSKMLRTIDTAIAKESKGE